MCLCVSGAGWLIDLFPCGGRVSDNEPLVTVMSAGPLQSALRLSRSLYGQNTSKHTVGHGCAHNQTAPCTKAPGRLKQILDTSSPEKPAVARCVTLSPESRRVKQLPASQRLLTRTQIASHHMASSARGRSISGLCWIRLIGAYY